MDDDEEELDFQEVIDEIADTEPTLGEVEEAVRKLKSGKAPGINNITAELLKTDIEFSTIKIHELLSKIWKFEVILEAWKKGLTIKLPKKGNVKDCKNSRGITVLFIVGKILGRIVIDRVRSGADKRLRTEHAGYRQGRGTTEQVFILRNIIEQVNEWQATIYVIFIDFEKAFNLVHRDSPWIIMWKYGISEKIIRITQLFYADFQCAGVKQGCNMCGFLFLMVMDWIMRRTVGKRENGIRWRLTRKLDDLDFADDVALVSSSRNQMQEKTSRMNMEAKRVGLKINLDKTNVIQINARNQAPIA